MSIGISELAARYFLLDTLCVCGCVCRERERETERESIWEVAARHLLLHR
jgi:hypothetical protein